MKRQRSGPSQSPQLNCRGNHNLSFRRQSIRCTPAGSRTGAGNTVMRNIESDGVGVLRIGDSSSHRLLVRTGNGRGSSAGAIRDRLARAFASASNSWFGCAAPSGHSRDGSRTCRALGSASTRRASLGPEWKLSRNRQTAGDEVIRWVAGKQSGGASTDRAPR